ncbi:MAG TPA: cupin domain-containing protein [Solirubrobacterales bacterium]|nr:cupin domain-containing protein [Solirubrobacterales bacterium]
MRRIRITLALSALALLAIGVAVGQVIAQSGGSSVTRTALAQSNKVRGVSGRTLGLSRVTIPVGGSIPLHHHQGTQVSYVQSGELTYTVKSGGVTVYRGPADNATAVRKISAGQTGKIRAGQWIVEQPSTVHRAANKGDSKIVIYLATLLKKGAPPSTPNG